MARKRKWTDEQLVEAVKNNYSLFGVLRELGLSMCGGSHALIKLRIKELELDFSHFTGQGWCKGEKHALHTSRFVEIPLEKILVKKSTYRIICPNCHTQTDNYAGKNKRRGSPTGRRHITQNDNSVGSTPTHGTCDSVCCQMTL